MPSLSLDLGAIAKGYGVDVVAQIIDENGLQNHMVEIGGEVVAKGLNARGEPWKIGVDTPGLSSLPGQQLQAILTLQNVAVATSGDYRNFFEYNGKVYSHTINPMSGKPVIHNLASVTVIAGNCMEADALATAVMVLGREKGQELIEQTNGVEAFFIIRESRDTYNTFASSGFEKYMFED
jgi:thiamine biosynthesis lipoprotein